ncbi:MAG TPA: quinone-dependent dihydroorotate dehydrogenase [Thermoanaerobaculia bacterium]|nr:quinone-dependent dihydroorotate dehydrogenase [Thermoanaerobaculia bacterium]
MAFYPLLRPLLFRLDPERAHALSLLALQWMGAVPPLRALQRRVLPRVDDPVEMLRLRFPNRVGLAAGYDKDARGLWGLAALGFGHVEIGTVTPRPQPGNPRPRLFRLVEDRSVVNRLGFPSQGAAAVAARLRRRPADVVVGVNIGKQRETPVERAVEDYLELLEIFAPLADYLTINVSSPNTPGLRRLETGEELGKLLASLARRRDELAAGGGKARGATVGGATVGGATGAAKARRVPLLVKLSPDLAPEDLDAAVDAALAAGIDGIVATNTTLSRPGAVSSHAHETGGLSGALLTAPSTAALARVAQRVAGRAVVIGAGGVLTGADAAAKRAAGADLVQLYTGLVYRGPALVRETALALSAGVAQSPHVRL